MKKFLGLTIALLLSLSNTVLAQSVAVPVGQQGAASQNIERPTRGSTKSQVSNRFGDPSQQFAAIGQPAISRWVYNKFTVYFEDDYVIHSVLHP
ncbi:hypothetical protein A9Q99_09460 [Gammaproteobacteria bacterium 45_16_T64]|nr:hypothetical protein A9Q99_09460 [Gammaproteobacteria bacterium 45_16_T64]